jgi:hypothetical protein
MNKVINTRGLKEDITLEKIEGTDYMSIDLYVEMQGITSYIGSINNIDNFNVNTQGIGKATINGLEIGSIIHNIKEVQIKRYSKLMTTLQVYTRIL